MHHSEHLPSILAFLREVGISVSPADLSGTTFLPGISIRAGTLLYDPRRLLWPSDLLHEAGHLAVLPLELRVAASDDLQDVWDTPGAGETEALAWAYAAAHHLKLPPAVLFHEGGYKGHSEGLILSYSLGVCPGLRGLCDAGLTFAPGFQAKDAHARSYPHMLRWLRE